MHILCLDNNVKPLSVALDYTNKCRIENCTFLAIYTFNLQWYSHEIRMYTFTKNSKQSDTKWYGSQQSKHNKRLLFFQTSDGALNLIPEPSDSDQNQQSKRLLFYQTSDSEINKAKGCYSIRQVILKSTKQTVVILSDK